MDKEEVKNNASNVIESKLYTEDEAKLIAWKAFMSRTDEREFEMIHRKSAKSVFEKWWNENK
jgi:hypothetical protein